MPGTAGTLPPGPVAAPAPVPAARAPRRRHAPGSVAWDAIDEDLYRLLGVSPAATAEEIHRAWRAAVRRLHPDTMGDRPAAEREAAERRLRDLNAAWAVLGDPARRREYDRRRARTPPHPGGSRGPGAGSRPRRPPPPVPRRREPTDPAAGCLRVIPVAVVGVLVAIIVVALLAGEGPRESRVPDTVAGLVGRCVVIHPGVDIAPVQCPGGDGLLVSAVPSPGLCPDGTRPRRHDPSGVWLCLRP